MQARRRGNGYYYVRVNGRRVSLGTKNQRVADLKVREHERRLADPAYAKAHAVTVDDACAAFLRDAPTAGNRAKPPAADTLEMWRIHCGHFCRVFGNGLMLAAVDAAAVERYIAERRSEPIPGKRPGRPLVSAQTVSKELSTLAKVLRAAARRGEYARPLESVLPERVAVGSRQLTRALRWPGEVDAFLAAWERWDRAAACCFVLGLGADKVCITAARAEDFDFDRGVVLVRGTKTAKRWAEVPIIDQFSPYVRRAYNYLRAHGRFPSWENNSERDIAAACRRAGVPRITLRDLRRTMGQTLRDLGVAPQLIGPMLRHADGRMSELHYAQLRASGLRRLVQAAAGPAGGAK